MTKKQYFLCAWGLASLDSWIFVVPRTFQVWSEMGYLPLIEIRSFILVLAIIILLAIVIYIGIGLAQRVGLRLLLLDDNSQYNGNKDILLPALVTASIYVLFILLIHTIIPIASVTFVPADFFRLLTLSLRFEIPMLLFCLPLIAVIFKKVARDASLNTIMPISIIMLFLLIHAAPLLACLYFKCGLERFIDLLYIPFTTAVLATLFWKKGFEAAVLCSMMSATILYCVKIGAS